MKEIALCFKTIYRIFIHTSKSLLVHPYLRLLYIILLILWVYWGTLATMPIMDITIKYLIHKNMVSYGEAEKWGVAYIFAFPLMVYSIVFYYLRKFIFLNVDYFKRVFDCINYLGLFMLFGNQYWKIDIFKILFGNEGFGGVILATVWFRFILTLRELKIPPNEVK